MKRKVALIARFLLLSAYALAQRESEINISSQANFGAHSEHKVHAQSASVFYGIVEDSETQQPIKNATISVFKDGNKIVTTNTFDKGIFHIRDLKPGKYSLELSADGYTTIHYTSVHVNKSKTQAHFFDISSIQNMEETLGKVCFEVIEINSNPRSAGKELQCPKHQDHLNAKKHYHDLQDYCLEANLWLALSTDDFIDCTCGVMICPKHRKENTIWINPVEVFIPKREPLIRDGGASGGAMSGEDLHLNNSKEPIKSAKKEQLKDEETVMLYPNPASESLFLGGLDLNTNIEVQLLNLQEQWISSVIPKDGRARFDVHALPNGNYFVRYFSAGKWVSKRFIVQH